MRKLEWPSWANDQLRDVVDVLNVINPKGHTAAHIKAHVQREFDAGLEGYVGTAGWYVTIYRAPGQHDVWHPLVTVMAYPVRKYLQELGKL